VARAISKTHRVLVVDGLFYQNDEDKTPIGVINTSTDLMKLDTLPLEVEKYMQSLPIPDLTVTPPGMLSTGETGGKGSATMTFENTVTPLSGGRDLVGIRDYLACNAYWLTVLNKGSDEAKVSIENETDELINLLESYGDNNAVTKTNYIYFTIFGRPLYRTVVFFNSPNPKGNYLSKYISNPKANTTYQIILDIEIGRVPNTFKKIYQFDQIFLVEAKEVN
jgi:hypothetical protein